MELLNGTNSKQLPSVILDPFSTDKVSAINIFYRPSQWSKHWSGNVHFQNGNTSGSQELVPSDSINELIEQIKIIGESLKK